MARKTVYTAQEAAELLGIHADTVRRAARDGELKAARFGRSLRISLVELARWFSELGGGELGEALAPPPLPADVASSLAAAEDAKNALRAAIRSVRADIWAAEDLDHIYDYMDALVDISSAHLYTARPDHDSADAARMLHNAEARRMALYESHRSCRVLAGYYLWVLCRDLDTVLITLGPKITAWVAQIVGGTRSPWTAQARDWGFSVVDELTGESIAKGTVLDVRGDEGHALARDNWLTVFEGYELLGQAYKGSQLTHLWALVDAQSEGLRWLPVFATSL